MYNLDSDIVSDLFGVVNVNLDIVINVYCDDEWFMNCYCFDEMCFFKEVVFNYLLFEFVLLELEGVSKVFFISDIYEKLLLLEQVINVCWGDWVSVSFFMLICLEVMVGGVLKGYVLEVVVQVMGYSLKECIVFGDGMNDVEMFMMVGKGCIMGNVYQCLKDLYFEFEVIGINVDNVVLYYLCDFFLC